MKVKNSKALLADLLRQIKKHWHTFPGSGAITRQSRPRPTRGLHIIHTIWTMAVLITALSTPSLAQSTPDGGTDIRITTAWSADKVRPGDRIIFAVIIEMDPGLHINADPRQLKLIEGFQPFPTELKIISGTSGFISEGPYYPRAHPVKFDFADEPLMVFDGRVTIYLPIRIDDQFDAPELKLNLQLAYQACGKDFCLFPERVKRTVVRPVTNPGAEVNTINAEVFADFHERQAVTRDQAVQFDLFGWTFTVGTESRAGWLLVLFIAAVGGLLLNVTPCVLPMIPIKIISLANAAENRGRCAMLGLSTLVGVVAFWCVLGLLIAFASGFTAANQLFQYPLFTIAVGLVITVMGLGMFGNVSVRLPQAVYRFHPENKTLSGSFGVGILTAVLSTPCTAPFMGAAAAFAVTQSPGATIAAFLAIGIGMGFPYLLLALFPGLMKRIPKTGPGSELVKQMMGLCMLAAAAYFIGIGVTVLLADPLKTSGKWYWWPVMTILATAGAWLALRAWKTAARRFNRCALIAVGIAMVGLSVWGGFQLTDRGQVEWISYAEEQFQNAIADKKVAVLVFTAEWCLNCKAIENNVFSDQKLGDILSRPDVATIKVDITGNNPAGKSKLRELGHLTIPLVAVFSPDGDITFKSDFYTASQLGQAILSALPTKTVDRSSN